MLPTHYMTRTSQVRLKPVHALLEGLSAIIVLLCGLRQHLCAGLRIHRSPAYMTGGYSLMGQQAGSFWWPALSIK